MEKTDFHRPFLRSPSRKPGPSFERSGEPYRRSRTPALSRSAFRLTRGKTRILRLKNASGTVRWTSSNKAVATVTSKGVVKGIKAGSAFIKAYYKGKTYKCAVVVEPRNYPPPR